MDEAKHLTASELEETVDKLIPIVKEYGTLGLDEAVAEIKRQIAEEDPEWL